MAGWEGLQESQAQLLASADLAPVACKTTRNRVLHGVLRSRVHAGKGAAARVNQDEQISFLHKQHELVSSLTKKLECQNSLCLGALPCKVHCHPNSSPGAGRALGGHCTHTCTSQREGKVGGGTRGPWPPAPGVGRTGPAGAGGDVVQDSPFLLPATGQQQSHRRQMWGLGDPWGPACLCHFQSPV